MAKTSRTEETPELETPSPPTVTVGATDFAALIDAAVEAKVAKIFSARAPDERIKQQVELARGIGLPLAPEMLVPCRSPITGSTFLARQIVSKSEGARVAELLEYDRPAGWDRKKIDGGIVPDDEAMPLKEQNGQPGKRYARWLYSEFLMRDLNAIGGKLLPAQWRADYAPAPGSVTLTPEQMAELGIDPGQLKAALEPKAA